MKGSFSIFKQSAKELKTVRGIVITGLLIAISMVIESFTIEIPGSKINFAFLAISSIGMLFGPVVGIIAGGLCDIVGFAVHPQGGFLPIYTLLGSLQGFIYGMILYHKRPSLIPSLSLEERGFSLPLIYIRAVIARLLDVIIINLICNTYANIHYGFIPEQSFNAIITTRIVKNAIELFADIPLLMILMPVIYTAYIKTAKGREIKVG